MVPIVGAITDQSTSRWGRRRPFMVWGSVIVSVGLLLLGWTEEITGLLITDEMMVRRPPVENYGRRMANCREENRRRMSRLLLRSLASMSWTLPSTLVGTKIPGFHRFHELTSVVAACSRSLIVDTLPRNQQQAGSAWGMWKPSSPGAGQPFHLFSGHLS